MDMILPKICPAVTPWEYLLMRSEFGVPPKPDPSQVYKDVKNLIHNVSSFFQVNIEPLTESSNSKQNSGAFHVSFFVVIFYEKKIFQFHIRQTLKYCQQFSKRKDFLENFF